MKFNPVVVKAVMSTQFDELRRVGGTDAASPDKHYPFSNEDVEEMFFNRSSFGKGVWFRLKDGRIFDVRGEVAQPATAEKLLVREEPETVSDQDSFDVLPLAGIPLLSGTLKNAKLVKNARLETAVELHNDSISGSLQIRPEDVAESFPRYPADCRMINDLAKLPSYDVYALRASLRKMGVEADDKKLQLTDDMKQRLDRHSSEFTHPLLQAVYGRVEADSREDLIKLFRHPDKARVAERLKQMSQKTGIEVEDLPHFLEEYSDLFLSVIYYRQGFERLVPELDRCAQWLRDTQQNKDATTPHAAAVCKKVDEALQHLSGSIRERLSSFRRSFDTFWRDMNRGTMERLRREVEDRYAGTGGMLCGATVKVRHWANTFRTSDSGGPATRAQYILSELEPGLDRLCRM